MRGALCTRCGARQLQSQARQPSGHRRLPQQEIKRVSYGMENRDRPAHIAIAVTAQDLNRDWNQQWLILVWSSGAEQFVNFSPCTCVLVEH